MIHVCNNYISSKVHKNLIEHLGKYERQYVIVPVRRKKDFNVNISANEGVDVRYVLYPNWLRYMPLIKVIYLSCVCLSVFKSIRSESVSGMSVLAHNLWSDGFPSLLISLIYKRKYSLVVRNTDMNIFLPKLVHYQWLVKCLIKYSTAMIFISHAHRMRFAEKWPNLLSATNKVVVIPNGISEFWLEVAETRRRHLIGTRPSTVIYVGRFDFNKNIHGLIKAIEIVRKDTGCTLDLVGGTEEQVLELCSLKEIPEWVNVYQWLDDDSQLRIKFETSRVFAMPSFRETFGLVYLEAIACGCAVLHSKNEGIDGCFKEDYIAAVNPNDCEDIAYHLKRLILDYPAGLDTQESNRCLEGFSWADIASKYWSAVK